MVLGNAGSSFGVFVLHSGDFKRVKQCRKNAGKGNAVKVLINDCSR